MKIDPIIQEHIVRVAGKLRVPKALISGRAPKGIRLQDGVIHPLVGPEARLAQQKAAARKGDIRRDKRPTIQQHSDFLTSAQV